MNCFLLKDVDKLEKNLIQLRDKYAFYNQSVFEEIDRSFKEKNQRYLSDLERLVSKQISLKKEVF